MMPYQVRDINHIYLGGSVCIFVSVYNVVNILLQVDFGLLFFFLFHKFPSFYPPPPPTAPGPDHVLRPSAFMKLPLSSDQPDQALSPVISTDGFKRGLRGLWRLWRARCVIKTLSHSMEHNMRLGLGD
mgnify:CR=1 FL=1